MKRTLALLLFGLLTVAAHADGFFRGAYWCTKAPMPGLRYAGALEIIFYDDLTFEADIFAGGSFIETVTAGYAETPRTFRFTFSDTDGWTYTGMVNLNTMLMTGTFKNALGTFKGKFQAVFVESPPPETDAKKAVTNIEAGKKSAPSGRGKAWF